MQVPPSRGRPDPPLHLDHCPLDERPPRVIGSPPSALTRQLWGIYLADALTKNRDVSTLSPMPMLRIHQISLRNLLSTVTPLTLWQWADNGNAPPLGNLRSMLSHHRVLAREQRPPPGSTRSCSDLVRVPPSSERHPLTQSGPATPTTGSWPLDPMGSTLAWRK